MVKKWYLFFKFLFGEIRRPQTNTYPLFPKLALPQRFILQFNLHDSNLKMDPRLITQPDNVEENNTNLGMWMKNALPEFTSLHSFLFARPRMMVTTNCAEQITDPLCLEWIDCTHNNANERASRNTLREMLLSKTKLLYWDFRPTLLDPRDRWHNFCSHTLHLSWPPGAKTIGAPTSRLPEGSWWKGVTNSSLHKYT